MDLQAAAFQIMTNGEEYQNETGHLHTFHYFEYLMKNMPNVMADNYFR